MKHTPGPWYKSGLTIRYDDGLSGTQPVIAEIQTDAGIYRASANARLIAAAPDLLAALTRIKGLQPSPVEDAPINAAIDIARTVIEKAEGRT